MPPKLTIGMASYDDYDGCYFTLQALRLYQDLRDVELLVVDNKPDCKGSVQLRNLFGALQRGRHHSARYIPAPEVVGTSAPRDRVFAEARGEAVMCLDSHVLLFPGAVAKLVAWYAANPDSHDLLSGPIVYDGLDNISTHFDPVWSGQMWGVWAQAWRAPCEDGDLFSVTNDNGRAKYVSLDMQRVPLSGSARCSVVHPDTAYPGHEKVLLEAGYKRLGFDPADEFDIPGQGLGLFSCRKSAWLGFNQHFRGFGGEELYIHEKFRQAGRRCLSLGFLQWVHRFRAAGDAPYPLTTWNKVRNYVLGHRELGLELDGVREHFVDQGKMPVEQWDALVENPEGHVQPTAKQPGSIDDLFESVRSRPRDLEKHMPKLRELAASVSHVTEFSKRKESLVALAAGQPESLVSHNTEAVDPVAQQAAELLPAGVVRLDANSSPDVPDIDDTDLLFIDSQHTEVRLRAELRKFARRVRRYILMHDTVLHANRGEDGGPGLMPAIREFVVGNPAWFVAYHTQDQYGLTVLSRQEQDRPAAQIHIWPLGYGPGTELKALLAGLSVEPTEPTPSNANAYPAGLLSGRPGELEVFATVQAHGVDVAIKMDASCGCNAKAMQMDLWGVDGCRTHRDEIVTWMREGAPNWKWTDRLKAARKSVTSGLVFKLNPLDPFPSLIDEAIRRAEVEEASKAAA